MYSREEYNSSLCQSAQSIAASNMQQVYIFLPHSPATEILPQSNSSSLKLVKKLVDALNYYGHGFHRDYKRSRLISDLLVVMSTSRTSVKLSPKVLPFANQSPLAIWKSLSISVSQQHQTSSQIPKAIESLLPFEICWSAIGLRFFCLRKVSYQTHTMSC